MRTVNANSNTSLFQVELVKLDLLTPRILGAVWLPLLGISPVAADEAKASVERIGPPSYYAPPVERYRSGSPDMNNPSYYPIPKTPVTRATYMEWIDNSGMLDFVDQPKRGMGGPTLLLPVLAKYVQTKDARWGQACIAMLKDYHRAFKVEIEAKGWVEQFAEPPAFIPVYRKHLLDGGLITPNEAWFRELWLDYCRHLHVWGSEPIEWRGPCHRSMPEALASKWYPDIPEAEHWKHYAELV